MDKEYKIKIEELRIMLKELTTKIMLEKYNNNNGLDELKKRKAQVQIEYKTLLLQEELLKKELVRGGK